LRGLWTGRATAPAPPFFQFFPTTLENLNEPIFAAIDFEIDIDRRKGRAVVRGVTEGRGEPIKNPVTGDDYRVRIDIPKGFEYLLAEIGRGWTTVSRPMQFTLAHSYPQSPHVNLCQSGILR